MKKNIAVFNWDLIVDLDGGRIEKLNFKNKTILGTFNRIDGKVGNTHICVPNFHNEGLNEYGLPVHGPARYEKWLIRDEKAEFMTIYCVLPALASYPAELYIEQTFVLTKGSFKHTVTVENVEGASVPVNIGIHDYWSASGGWKGTKVNGIDVLEKVMTNDQLPARKSNTIAFPDGRRIRLKLNDFNDIKLWTAFNDQKEFDEEYLCIEPVKSLTDNYFGSKQSLLKEGKSIRASQEISLL